MAVRMYSTEGKKATNWVCADCWTGQIRAEGSDDRITRKLVAQTMSSSTTTHFCQEHGFGLRRQSETNNCVSYYWIPKRLLKWTWIQNADDDGHYGFHDLVFLYLRPLRPFKAARSTWDCCTSLSAVIFHLMPLTAGQPGFSLLAMSN